MLFHITSYLLNCFICLCIISHDFLSKKRMEFFFIFSTIRNFPVEKEIVMSRQLEFIQFEDQAARIPVYTQLQNNVFLTIVFFFEKDFTIYRNSFYLKLRAVFIIFLSSLSLLGVSPICIHTSFLAWIVIFGQK